MKKCSFCGEYNPDSTEICPWCGRPDQKLFPEKYKFVANDNRAPKKNKGDLFKQIRYSLSSKLFSFFKKHNFDYLFAPIAVIIIMGLIFVFLFNKNNSMATSSLYPTEGSSTRRLITLPPPPTLSPTYTPIPIPIITPIGIIIMHGVPLYEGPNKEFDEIPESLFPEDEFIILGKSLISSWIQIETQKGVTGWILYDPENTSINLSFEKIPLSYFRPESSLIKSPIEQGINKLLIRNDSLYDAIVIMVQKNIVNSVAYIRKGENFAINNIHTGNYNIFFSTGENWNGENFTKIIGRGRFLKSFRFHSNKEYYETWSISLRPTSSGNAMVINVSEEKFPEF